MNLFSVLLFSLFFTLPFAHADESEIRVTLPSVQFSGRASFETLNQDTFVPATETKLGGEHATTLDTFQWQTPYSLTDYGFPGGATSINVGGRTADDTQVSTLGVPLNLPQGSSDLSIFPSYLWFSATISPTTSGAGFAPAAASGRVEFTPWTRQILLDRKLHGQFSRATVSYDHDAQTYSMGTRTDQFSLLVGASTGKQEGISGEGSGIIFQNPDSHILVHILGTNVKGDSPGSLSFPSPRATFKNWRVIPVVESSFHLSEGMEFQSTAFADLSNQVYDDPASPFSDTDTRTQQGGIENVLQLGLDTLSVSARFVRYLGNTYGEVDDLPLYSEFTHEYFLSNETSLKASVNGVRQRSSPVYGGGRLSFKFATSEKNYPFAELNTVAKLPSLTDRYFVVGNYHGNPNLKAERVYAGLAGYHAEQLGVVSTTTLKAETRNDVQVPDASGFSTINAGTAYLFSLNQEFSMPLIYWLNFQSNSLFTYSHLKQTSFSYPDLPYVSTTAGLLAHYLEVASLGTDARLVGVSAGPGGKAHSGYALFDIDAGYRIDRTVELHVGVENVLDSQAQAVLDYPLEGRRFFASLSASL